LQDAAAVAEQMQDRTHGFPLAAVDGASKANPWLRAR
jgi:hypothetical protein